MRHNYFRTIRIEKCVLWVSLASALGASCGCAILGEWLGMREMQEASAERAANSPSGRIQIEGAMVREELIRLYD